MVGYSLLVEADSSLAGREKVYGPVSPICHKKIIASEELETALLVVPAI